MNDLKFGYCLWRVRQGDIKAMEPIYSEYYEKLVFTAKRILHNEMSAEDAASETILKLIEYVKDNEHPKIANPGAYLYASVKNIAFDMYKRDKDFYALDAVGEMAATTDTDNTDKYDLEKALDKLDDVEFDIATMFYFYGYKIKQISVMLSTPEGTVKWKLYQIRASVSKFFEKSKKFEKF